MEPEEIIGKSIPLGWRYFLIGLAGLVIGTIITYTWSIHQGSLAQDKFRRDMTMAMSEDITSGQLDTLPACLGTIKEWDKMAGPDMEWQWKKKFCTPLCYRELTVELLPQLSPTAQPLHLEHCKGFYNDFYIIAGKQVGAENIHLLTIRINSPDILAVSYPSPQPKP